MSLITRTYTFTDGTTAYGSQVDSEIQNIVNVINNLDAGTTTWDIVKAVNGASTPLIADNSAGSNTIFEARANGVAKFTVGSTGAFTAANGGTVSGASLTMSGQTIAMGSNKITGLANGTAATDAAAFGQLITNNIVGTTTNDNATAGNIGESVRSQGGAVSIPGTGTYGDLTSISLTAGDWLLTAVVTFIGNGATISGQHNVGISTTSGNSTAGLTLGDNLAANDAVTIGSTVSFTTTIPNYRLSLTTTTTVYLKCRDVYVTAQEQANFRLSAVRIR